MTIAEQVKNYHTDTDKVTGIESIKDYNEFVSECEQKAVDTEQDWDSEKTTYEFADRSIIIWTESEILTYSSRD